MTFSMSSFQERIARDSAEEDLYLNEEGAKAAFETLLYCPNDIRAKDTFNYHLDQIDYLSEMLENF